MTSFRARARTVEMLGRQQIAGIPTAISEIFKNAHDAYASKVEADFIPGRRLLVIRDNGYGMTYEEFISRWLTLGTDSKVGGGVDLPSPPAGAVRRVMLGEKGIGRLAVAIIGPHVLILTRAMREGKSDELVAAFVNWSAFDLPAINLDEVIVPTRRFAGGSLPSVSDIEDMVSEALANVETFGSRVDGWRLRAATEALVSFGLTIPEVTGQLEGLSLAGNGHGTQFYIAPTNPALSSDLEPPSNTSQPSQLFQSLIGFTNTMTPDHEKPSIEAAFRYHARPGLVEDVVESGAFFTPDEFLLADHSFTGAFDSSGTFTGTASIYGDPRPYVLPWRTGRDRRLECGPFKFSLAVIQAKQTESRIEAEQYNEISQKLSFIGGIYIYKDGIRVLPYGRQDHDYLDIERNRSKGASYYYYSYRNIFGAIQLTADSNPNLKEKAGREGFQDNIAWRDFRDVLKSFLLQSAADFFRAGGDNSDVFEQTRGEMQRIDQARRDREKQTRERRRKFQASLDTVFAVISDGRVNKQISNTMNEFDARASRAVTDGDAELLLRAEEEARRGINAVRASIAIARPRGVAMPASLRRDWDAYLGEVSRVEMATLTPAFERIASRVSNASISIGEHVDRRRRLTSALDEAIQQAQHHARATTRNFDAAVQGFKIEANGLRDSVSAMLVSSAAEAREAVASIDFEELSDAELVSLQIGLEDLIGRASATGTAALQTVMLQIEDLKWDTDSDGIVVTSVDVAASAEEELIALRERVEQDLEMAQLGMAVSVIDHEFQAAVRTIRASLRRLRAWADVNPPLMAVYSELRTSFDHLDGYLTLFTPLQRRLRRTPVEIRGGEIGSFVETVFSERFRSQSIEFEVSLDFRRLTITGYPSTFYPVFVNIVDNDIFWLGEANGPRMILLDADGKDLLISDSGPGVSVRDREGIFDAGFTRKPGGRGLGLNISKRALASCGYQLSLDKVGRIGGTTFRISAADHGDS